MPKFETPRELAVRLLHENRDHMAKSIYKLVSRLGPRWSDVDESAFCHNAKTLLQAAELYLGGQGVDALMSLVRDMMRVRRLGGFTGVDFNVLLHAYMPVVRKAFLSQAPSLREGLAAYDVAESVCLPLFTRVVEAIARADEQTAPDASPPFHGRPFEEISVDENMPPFMQDLASDEDDDSDEEPTFPRAQRPAPKAQR